MALVAVVVCVSAVACSLEPDLPQVRGAPDTGSGDVCDLLTGEEVEVAVNDSLPAPVRSGGPQAAPPEASPPDGVDPPAGGDPLAAQPSAGDSQAPIVAGMEMCARTGGPEAASARWGVLATDAEEVFTRYRDWHADYVEEVDVGGHEGIWDPRLRILVVLSDEHVVAVSLTVPELADRETDPADGDAGDDDGGYVREQARDLAGRALRRL